jgi:hypothetical protein
MLASMAMYSGLATTICIRCLYGVFGREITKCMVIGVFIRSWPTLHMFELVCFQVIDVQTDLGHRTTLQEAHSSFSWLNNERGVVDL